MLFLIKWQGKLIFFHEFGEKVFVSFAKPCGYSIRHFQFHFQTHEKKMNQLIELSNYANFSKSFFLRFASPAGDK